MSTISKASDWEIAPGWKMASYGCGYLIITFLLGNYTAFVFYFYEVEMGIPVILVGIAMVIFAIWNMINDPLLGYLTEKPLKWTKKWGMRAPWIVLSIIPTLIIYFLIFTPPVGLKKNVFHLFLYMIIISCLFDTFFSIFNSHIYGGFANHFPSEYERRRGFARAVAIAGIGVIFIGLLPPLIIQYGKPETFALMALVVVLLNGVCAILLLPSIRESKQMKEMFIRSFETAEKTSYFKTLKTGFGKKNFVVSLLAYTLVITTQALSSASGIYFVKDVLRLPLWVSIFTGLAGFVGFIIAIPFWASYARKHGFKQTYCVCLILAAISYIPTLFITELWQSILFTFLGGIPYAGYTIMTTPIVSDCYDEIACATGKRQEATFQGIRTFFFRIAFLVVAIVITVVHIITAYNPNPLAKQTPLAILGIRIHAGLFPIIFMLTAAIAVYIWYDLVGEKKEEMIKKLKDMNLYR